MTVASLRDRIHQTLLVGLPKKIVKMARIITSAGVDMTENPRATIKSFKLMDGAVLDFQLQGRGGGKRGASSISKSKEQVLQLLSEEVLNGVMHLYLSKFQGVNSRILCLDFFFPHREVKH